MVDEPIVSSEIRPSLRYSDRAGLILRSMVDAWVRMRFLREIAR